MTQTARLATTPFVARPPNLGLLRDERLHELLTASAGRVPDKPALICGADHVTYAELDARTGRWGATLCAGGVGPGCVVGVWLDRSIALHAAVLAVLKAGATFLPFDAETPPDRVAACLADCGAALLLVDAAHAARAEGLGAPVLSVAALGAGAGAGVTPRRPAATDPAYIIYTSGSTGRPKGIAVSHRSICHLARAENVLLGVTGADTVYQGFSAAFDMALEEVFISFLAGATVFVPTAAQARAIDRLPALLDEAGVTVLHAVPTLLAMLDGDVPGLRLINVGGEACPEALVERWWRPGRRMVNTYGPTETTVTATAAELRPGEPVTIGHPLPNYTAVVVDEAGDPVRPGKAGELCIGGPGVSLGYVNRPELSAERFVPMAGPDGHSREFPMFYRTGDRASLDAAGRLVLHGRLDSQVKHRGYRIELGEIEAELCRLPGVRTAAVLLQGEGAAAHLAAYLVPSEGAAPRREALRAGLAARLPCYMVPAAFHVLAAMPRLSSGKVDRKALPVLPLPEAEGRPVECTPAEAPLLAAVQALFPGVPAGVDDDVFTGLGGHSLLAAALVSQLRKQERFRRMSLRDLYELRTVARLARRFPIETSPAREPLATAKAEARPHPGNRLRHALCAAAQVPLLGVVLGLASMEFLLPYLAFDQVRDRSGLLPGTAMALAVFVAIPPLLMLVAVVAKWLLLGRVQEGQHPLWGGFYLRWWFIARLLALVNTGLLADTPLMAVFCRLLGARVGKQAHLGSVEMGAHDLAEIGTGADLGSGVLLNNARVEGGWLKLGRVRVGADACIGSGCVLEGGSAVGAGGELANLSLLADGVAVPAGEAWSGSPAAFRAVAAPPRPRPAVGRLRWAAAVAGFLGVAGLLLPLLHLLPVVPALFALAKVQDAGLVRQHLLIFAPLIALGYTVLVLAEVAGLRWLVLGQVREGEHSTASSFFLRKWTVDRLLELSLTVLHPIYASLYVVPFFRALGARVGRGAEISTAASVTHDLLEIGEDAFVADAVVLGEPEIRRGRLTLRRTVLGRRAFVGNCALLPDGVHIPDDALVGCLSVPPDGAAPLAAEQACFGSPAILLPSRQVSTAYDPRLLYRPGRRQMAERLLIEGLRILLPRAAVFAMICLALDAFEALSQRLGWGPALLAVPVLYIALFCMPALGGTVALKWALVRRYRAAEHPLWSRPVWFSEAVTAIYEGLPVALLLQHLRGTPFLPLALRLFGARIGQRTWLDTTDLTEFDLVRIGDEAELGQDSGPQTHLFEDRVMKIGSVELGRRAVMGANSIALPGARLEDGARLGALSLVMKGETVPAGTRWAGSPARAAP